MSFFEPYCILWCYWNPVKNSYVKTLKYYGALPSKTAIFFVFFFFVVSPMLAYQITPPQWDMAYFFPSPRNFTHDQGKLALQLGCHSVSHEGTLSSLLGLTADPAVRAFAVAYPLPSVGGCVVCVMRVSYSAFLQEYASSHLQWKLPLSVGLLILMPTLGQALLLLLWQIVVVCGWICPALFSGCACPSSNVSSIKFLIY